MKNSSSFDRAVRAAEKGIKNGEGGPFGAAIVKGKKIVAVAHNTVLKTHDPTAHAEINAIRIASRNRSSPFFDGCVMVTTTEPCPMCFSALHWGRFEAIVYATRINDVKRLGFNELLIPVSAMKRRGKSRMKLIRVKNKKCEDLLAAWEKLKRRKTY